MSFAWINDNVKLDLADIYDAVGCLAMIAGHPWKNLVRARGPVPTETWPPATDAYVDGPLRLALASSRAGMIVELRIGDLPWFEMRQETFETASFEAYDWGDYYAMSIDAAGNRVGLGDAYNSSEHRGKLQGAATIQRAAGPEHTSL